MLAKIKTGFGQLSVNNFILKVRYILSMLATGGNFPSLPHPISEVESDLNLLSELQSRVLAGNRINIGSRDSQQELVHRKMTANAAYVNSVAMGNPSMLETSGFELVKPRMPYPIPAVIEKLICKPVQPAGSVKATWKAAKERDYYVVQMRIGENGAWNEAGTSTKTSFTVPGLAFKQDVYFRVAAVNAAGMGVWSDVAMTVVDLDA